MSAEEIIFIVRIVIAVIGVIFCFFGWKLYKSFIWFIGFLLFLSISIPLLMLLNVESNSIFFWSIIIGFIGGWIFLGLHFIVVFLTGVVLGGVLHLYFFVLFKESDSIFSFDYSLFSHPFFLFLFAIIGGIFALKLEKFFIIFSSAIIGALIYALCLRWLPIAPVLAIIGAIFQYGIKLSKVAYLRTICPLILVVSAAELSLQKYVSKIEFGQAIPLLNGFISLISIKKTPSFFGTYLIPTLGHFEAFLALIISLYLAIIILKKPMSNFRRISLSILIAGLASWSALLMTPTRLSYIDFAIPPYHWPALNISVIFIWIGVFFFIFSFLKKREAKD